MSRPERTASRPGGAVPPPDLSVVVPSVTGWPSLAGCLEALHAQSGDARLEVVVADRLGEEVRAPLAETYPGVRLVEAPPGAGIPELRRLAFDECRAPVVGVIEDHVIVPTDWAERMLAEHRAGHPVVAGAVENAARGTSVDRAAFLCEYSHCLDVPRSDAAEWVTGNNVTYRRDLLEAYRDVIAEGRWEDRLHAAMRADGVPLAVRPGIRVGHAMHYTLGEYLAQRYLYARSFAGMRLSDRGRVARLLYGAAAPALPPLLLLRIVTRARRAGVPRREVLEAIPLLALFVSAWAVGEAVGAWAGPGRSLASVR